MKKAMVLLPACFWLAAAAAFGADWPTWRCDASRSGASPEALPDSLRLQWVRELPPVVPAWPNEARLQFDASYEPVVAGKLLFLGSPNDGTVTAYDTETGELRWKFLTGGPVRFAPVASKDRLYVGSDDGWLYCLGAADGTLRWKVRGAPEDRPDRRHLGNGRFISFWPVRGGPVLADGTVYFAAGIWPTMGVFVLAVDAETGKKVWANREANYIEKVRIDHNEQRDSGLSPQGYLAVEGDTLLVPNGRSMPAFFDRKTGKLMRYLQGYRNGYWRIAATPKYVFVGKEAILDTATAREVGSRFAAAGDKAPKAFNPKLVDLFESPCLSYNLLPACSAWSVLAGDTAFGSHQGTFYAYDLGHAKLTLEEEKNWIGEKVRPLRWEPPELWKLASPQAKTRPPSEALIKAGNRLYGHAGKTLLAVELPAAGGEPKIAWQQDVAGTPSCLLAADGRLFAVTREGKLFCFGAGPGEPKTHALVRRDLPKSDDEWTKTAAEILKATQVSEGYAVLLGIGTGRLAEELLVQSKLRIIAVDADAEKVRRLHEKLTEAGLYGTRAEVILADLPSFSFPPYLASLMASEARIPSDVGLFQKLIGVLRPYGGTLCVALPDGEHEGFAKCATVAGLEASEVARTGGYSLLRRAGPLPGSADWTHEAADAGRSYCSKDRRVQTPLGVLWYGDGADHGFWTHHDYLIGVVAQVAGGRLFAINLSMRTLFAYDAYTGRLLWKTPIERPSQYASMPDAVYVAQGDRCIVRDPATGVARAEFLFKVDCPEGGKTTVADIRVSDDVILLDVNIEAAKPLYPRGHWDGSTLVALDRKDGRTLWTRKAKQRFNGNSLALGRGLVFCVDSPSPLDDERAKRRGEPPKTVASEVLGLDPRTGAVRWSATTEAPDRAYTKEGWLGIDGRDDWAAYSDASGLLLTGREGMACAFEAATGKPVWREDIKRGQPLILRGDTFIHQSGKTFDLRTGKPLKTPQLWWERGGCNYTVGTEYLLFMRDATACILDTTARTRHYLRNIRSGCSNSLIAADGLLNVPCFSVGCVCNYPIQTSFAMVHMPEVAEWAGTKPLQLGERAAEPPK